MRCRASEGGKQRRLFAFCGSRMLSGARKKSTKVNKSKKKSTKVAMNQPQEKRKEKMRGGWGGGG